MIDTIVIAIVAFAAGYLLKAWYAAKSQFQRLDSEARNAIREESGNIKSQLGAQIQTLIDSAAKPRRRRKKSGKKARKKAAKKQSRKRTPKPESAQPAAPAAPARRGRGKAEQPAPVPAQNVA